MALRRPVGQSVKESEESELEGYGATSKASPVKRKANPAMDAAIKRRMARQSSAPTQQEEVTNKRKQVGM